MNSKSTRHAEETVAKGRGSSGAQEPVLGLRQNLAQFSLLVLVNAFVGGMVGLPIPFILMWAPSWGWITVANFLLGINQGLCWSTTVIMKIDLVGPQRRGSE